MSAVRTERDGSVLHLVLDDEPRRNVLCAATSYELLCALRSVGAHSDGGHNSDGDHGDPSVIVIESASKLVFCTGADVRELMSAWSPWEIRELVALLPELIKAMRRCARPIVARVDGLCLAGGVGLALGADIVVAGDTAQFGLTELDVGLWPFIVSAVLERHCSPKRLMDLILSGEWIDATTAHQIGMVSRVVPADRMDAELDRLTGVLTHRSSWAVRMGKQALATGERLSFGQALHQAQNGLAEQIGPPITPNQDSTTV